MSKKVYTAAEVAEIMMNLPSDNSVDTDIEDDFDDDSDGDLSNASNG